MDTKQLFLVSLLISTGFAWRFKHPTARHRQALTMEARARGSSLAPWTGSVLHTENGVQQLGSMDLCKSVKPKAVGISQNTAIHFCVEGSNVCYFTALRKCCDIPQSSPFPVGVSDVQLGSKEFRVNFNLIGGFGNGPAGICHFVVDDTIDVCESFLDCEEPDCATGTEACLDNVEPDTVCDMDTGCTCKRGYQAPECCNCAPRFFKNEEGVCEGICLENCLRGSQQGCIQCLPGFQLEGLGCCNCAGDLVGINCDRCPPGQLRGSNNQCFICREGQILSATDECVCPPGRIEFSGECVDPCEENCAPNRFDQTFGCSLCKTGYRTRPLCCDCTSDRILVGTECVCPLNRVVNPITGVCETCSGDKVPVNGVCKCPEGTIEQGNTCFDCPAPKVVRDGSCQCPEDQEERNGDCITPPKCGENQDVIFLLDITQSFVVSDFRRVVHALQFIVGASKSQESNFNIALVLYPYLFDNPGLQDRPASLKISLDTSCTTAVEGLDDLAYSVDEFQSTLTSSYGAIEYVEDNMVDGMNLPTTVMTLTDGPSNIPEGISSTSSRYPINRINAAISRIQRSRPSTRFYAAGVKADLITESDDALFSEELRALGENIDSHSGRTDSNITEFTNLVIDLLVEARVLCPNQRTEILTGLQSSPPTRYPNCIADNVALLFPSQYSTAPCYPNNICSLPPPSKFASNNNLERRILEAVEQVLYERRLMAQGK